MWVCVCVGVCVRVCVVCVCGCVGVCVCVLVFVCVVCVCVCVVCQVCVSPVRCLSHICTWAVIYNQSRPPSVPSCSNTLEQSTQSNLYAFIKSVILTIWIFRANMLLHMDLLYLLDQMLCSISRCSQIVAALLDVLNEIVAALNYQPCVANIGVVHAHMNKPRDSMATSKTGKEYTVVTV